MAKPPHPGRTRLKALPFVTKLADGEPVEGCLLAQFEDVGGRLARRHRFHGGDRSEHGDGLAPFGDGYGFSATYFPKRAEKLFLASEALMEFLTPMQGD